MIVSTVQRWIGIGMLITLALVVAWGLRVDHLRAGYKNTLNRIVIVLDEVTHLKNKPEGAAVAIQVLGRDRQQYLRERDDARQVVERQSASIREYEAETNRLTTISEQNRKIAATTIAQRDMWIKRARQAETRTQRLSAEAELEECNAVLDAIYRDGF